MIFSNEMRIAVIQFRKGLAEFLVTKTLMEIDGIGVLRHFQHYLGYIAAEYRVPLVQIQVTRGPQNHGAYIRESLTGHCIYEKESVQGSQEGLVTLYWINSLLICMAAPTYVYT